MNPAICEFCGGRLIGGLCHNYGCEFPEEKPLTHLAGNYARGPDRALCGVIITSWHRLAKSGEPTCHECAVIDEEDQLSVAKLQQSKVSPRMLRRIAEVRVKLRQARKAAEPWPVCRICRQFPAIRQEEPQVCVNCETRLKK